ncbi:hypothetical protein CTRI78_v007843 [Colletotrichum trifolii]|uniref:Uncharacterized protein n=1 Tax=Colletotrichum trifolii TaxID=5466 RepID=A0A4R8R119_COLTR|nr:hypothetical protein CTRI78_v007843 [Colletotrichum trifolii]
MQITNIFLSALATAAAVSASPVAKRETKSMMAAAPEWTIEGFTRTCNAQDTSCDYSFNINTHTAAVTPCKFTTAGSPASRAASNAVSFTQSTSPPHFECQQELRFDPLLQVSGGCDP